MAAHILAGSTASTSTQSGEHAPEHASQPIGTNKPDREDPFAVRVGVVFNEISLLASAVERFGVLLVAAGDEDARDASAYHTAIKALSAQICLLADIGLKTSSQFTWNGADAAKWLLPPLFHKE